MNLNFNSGTLHNINNMTIEIKKESKTFQVEISAENGEPTATIRDMDSDIEIDVFTKKADTLEDLLTEINFHLTDVK